MIAKSIKNVFPTAKTRWTPKPVRWCCRPKDCYLLTFLGIRIRQRFQRVNIDKGGQTRDSHYDFTRLVPEQHVLVLEANAHGLTCVGFRPSIVVIPKSNPPSLLSSTFEMVPTDNSLAPTLSSRALESSFIPAASRKAFPTAMQSVMGKWRPWKRAKSTIIPDDSPQRHNCHESTMTPSLLSW